MFDETDRKILDRIQFDFPLLREPYKILAIEMNITEDELFKRVKKLKNNGVIKRIAASFDFRKMGFTSTLVALDVPESRLEEVVKVINEYPGVTHNYLRDGNPNLWFTLIVRSKDEIKKIVSSIRKKTGIDNIMDLYALRLFKIKVKLDTLE